MQQLDLPDADLRYWPALFGAEEAVRLFEAVRAEVAWRQHRVTVFGKQHLTPRLTAWYGDPGAVYTYSSARLEPLAWVPPLDAIRDRVGGALGVRFNSVLCNLYRDGRDKMGWHSDDEPELGPEPLIASVSLGAERRFVMKHRRRAELRFGIGLEDGSLLVMGGPTQRMWAHAVTATARPVGPRINLTFRIVREVTRVPRR
jgi:alkylated DNA repair dioxygenase AlkB